MPSGGKKKHKKPSRKKSELDSALDQIGDESAAAATKEFQDLLGEAKGDTSELVRQNAEEVERRLVLLKNERSTRKTSITSLKIKNAICGCTSMASRRKPRNAPKN
jgi:hypothetical protein